MNMLSGDPFPKLRGKASENKTLLLPLSAVLDNYNNLHVAARITVAHFALTFVSVVALPRRCEI